AMGVLPDLVRRWTQGRRLAVGLQDDLSRRTSTMGAVVRFLRLSMQSLVLGLGAWLVIERAMSPAAIFAASLLLGRALQPVEQVIGQWQALLGSRAALGRLRRELASSPVLRQAPAVGPRIAGHLVCHAVSHAVAGRRTPILDRVSFVLEPGACVGLIGPSGAGKSTLVRTLVGALRPTSGRIELGGVPVSELVVGHRPWPIGFMPQDVQLYDDTVAANIARFSEGTEQEVLRAARLSGAHELVMRLPQGYLTRIGEGGRMLSGGMRQRIGLARAVFGHPSLVVLDEPSASLDKAGEAALAECIAALGRSGTTVLIISHRQASMTLASSFLVLVEGRLAASGSREDVLQRLASGLLQAEPIPDLTVGADRPVRRMEGRR
ncbi:MAG: ATP-binding cassette domain-containing protein, partial [Hyphomicrobiaceae bacterium]